MTKRITFTVPSLPTIKLPSIPTVQTAEEKAARWLEKRARRREEQLLIESLPREELIKLLAEKRSS